VAIVVVAAITIAVVVSHHVVIVTTVFKYVVRGKSESGLNVKARGGWMGWEEGWRRAVRGNSWRGQHKL
jgi:hypothetical protein